MACREEAGRAAGKPGRQPGDAAVQERDGAEQDGGTERPDGAPASRRQGTCVAEQDGGAERPDGAPASRRQGTCAAAMAIAQTAPASSRGLSLALVARRAPCWPVPV